MTSRDADNRHPIPTTQPDVEVLGVAEDGMTEGIVLNWSVDPSINDQRTRRSRRRSAIAALLTVGFFVLMVTIDTAWSFLAGVGAVLAVDHWDRKVRSDPSENPVLAYFIGIIFGGIAVLAVAAVLITLVVLVLP